MTKLLKPMLAAKPDPADLGTAIAALKYPVLASPKLDGIRATVQGGCLLSRSLKPIPNLALQKLWGRKELEGLDGEIICGPPTAEDCFNRTTGQVRRRDGGSANAVFHVFDRYDAAEPFAVRIKEVMYLAGGAKNVDWLFHKRIENVGALLRFEVEAIERGFEGVCVRDPGGLYKQGRSTLREGGLVAVKRFVDAEAVVLSVYEQQENTNEKIMDALGHSKRSAHKAGKVGKDSLGGFTAVMLPRCRCHGIILPNSPALKPCTHSFNIGTGVGLTDAVRKELWAKRKSLPGKIVKFRYQKIGTMEAPRLPIWLGFRDGRDL